MYTYVDIYVYISLRLGVDDVWGDVVWWQTDLMYFLKLGLNVLTRERL